jgi:hypothetical protein
MLFENRYKDFTADIVFLVSGKPYPTGLCAADDVQGIDETTSPSNRPKLSLAIVTLLKRHKNLIFMIIAATLSVL